MKIALVGFMGTGKSSVGKVLAEKIDFHFIETDNLIEEKAGMSIPEIFSRKGEDDFRRLESHILQEVVAEKDNLVLATGGGIVLSSRNRQLLQNKTMSVLLEASPEEIYKRTREDGERPLLAGDNPRQKIEDLLKARHKYYGQFSRKIITDGKTPVQIADEIVNLLGDDKDAVWK